MQLVLSIWAYLVIVVGIPHPIIPIASALPVAVAGHRFGLQGGAVAGLVAIPASLLVVGLLEAQPDLLPFAVGQTTALLAGLTAGGLRERSDRVSLDDLEPRTETAQASAQQAWMQADIADALCRVSKLVALGERAASSAHEINNTLTYLIIGAAQLEEHIVGLGIESTEVLEQIRQQQRGLQRIRTIVEDMDTLIPKSEVVRRGVDLREVVTATLAVTRHATDQVIPVRLELGEVPPVQAAEDRLVQVLVNLVLNAAQAIQASGESGQILVATGTTLQGEAWVAVQDTGPGIPDAHLRSIFEPFFTTKDPEVGTGLGLHVSRMLVERFGGRIEVHSDQGTGSRFCVILPSELVAQAVN